MHKILSYLLICTGLLIILFAVKEMYQVFVNAGQVPALVSFTDLTLNTQAGPVSIPMKQANILANLGLFALFMGFLVAAGGKIASVGCQMLKTERLREALLQLRPGNITEQDLKNL